MFCSFFQVSPDCKYLQTTVTFEIGKEIFTAVGKRLLSPGYTSVMTWQAIPSDENIPACSVGEECNIDEVGIVPCFCFQKGQCFQSSPVKKKWTQTLWLFGCCLKLGMNTKQKLMFERQSCCLTSGEAAGETDITTGLFDRVGTDHVDGETRDRNRRVHSCAHQQHLWEELCADYWRKETQTHNSWYCARTRVSKGKHCFSRLFQTVGFVFVLCLNKSGWILVASLKAFRV